MLGSQPKLVVIGASAGGIEALRQVFEGLSPAFPIPIVVVLHLSADSTILFSEVFPVRGFTVKEAEDKEPIQSGRIYFAPPNYHLSIESDKTFSLSNEGPVHFSRPSIDILFETAAEVFSEGCVGVLLTGASSDGAEGLRLIFDRGGKCLVQSPETASFAHMPESAINSVPEARVIPLEDIGKFLTGLVLGSSLKLCAGEGAADEES